MGMGLTMFGGPLHPPTTPMLRYVSSTVVHVLGMVRRGAVVIAAPFLLWQHRALPKNALGVEIPEFLLLLILF